MPIQANSSQTSELFQNNLEKACLKIDRKVICECYSKSVTARYEDKHLAAISNLMKDKEANQMFLLVHSHEGMKCQSQVETR